jgi:thiol-disulfide isomerase/thioredoxin
MHDVPPDSVMEARMKADWLDVREYWSTSMEDSSAVDPRWRLASEHFEYYRESPTTPTGKKAGESALLLWQGIPAPDSVTSAIRHLKSDALIWPTGVQAVEQALARARRYDEAIPILDSLEDVVNVPVGRSALFMIQARMARNRSDTVAMRHDYEVVIKLNADRFDVQKARSALYELDSLRVGQSAPDFDAVSIDGDRIRLAELRGKVVLLEFWSTTCGPCMPLIPYIRALHEELPSEEFVAIGVADDDDMEVLRTFLAERGMSWSQIRQNNTFDDTGYLQMDPMMAAYNVFGIPRSFLIDRGGIIVAKDLRDEALDQATRDLVASGT